MSQVIRKFKESGKIEQSQPELFERRGVGKYNKAELVAGMYRNIDTYIKNNNLSGDRANSFRSSADQFIKGIENGTITMNSDGTFSDASGTVSSTGKFDKNWIGKKKDTANNAFNLVGDYALEYINQMPQYTAPAPKPKSKFEVDKHINKEISKKWYGGRDVDLDNWFKNRSEQDRNSLLAEIVNNTNFDQLFQDYDWTDTGVNSVEDLANRFKKFGMAISNNTLDNDDYNSFAALGGSNLDRFLKVPTQTTVPSPEEDRVKTWEAEAKEAGARTPEAVAAFVKGKRQQEEDADRNIIKEQEERDYRRERDTFFNDYTSKNPFRETIASGYAPLSTSYSPEDFDKPLKDFYNNDVNQYLNDNLSRDWFKAGNGTHIANHIDYILNHLQMNLPDAGDGFVAVPSTYDFSNYTTMIYNPTTRQYKESSMLANDALKRIAEVHYKNTRTPKKEDGGVLYMQFGGAYDANAHYSNYLQRRTQEKKTKEEETVKQKAESKGRTVEEQQKADRKPGSITSGEWTGADYTRLASIVADIGSIGAAYVPVYGTAVSAGLGIGSSLANYGADLSENGFSGKDLGNLAMNLGLDAVGLIPGLGAGAKGSKILKTAVKYIPRTLSLLALHNYTGPAIESMKKALNPDAELTVDDWRNIAEGFKLVLQGGKGVKRTIQAGKLKKELATGNSVLTTLGGKEVSVSPSDLSEIRSHRKIEDQQAALQLLKGDNSLQLAGDLNKRWFNPSRYLPNSNVRKEYDFNKKKTVRTSKGLMEVPVVHSASDKYIAATMQSRAVPRIPGFEEIAIKYNDWKYGVKKPKAPQDVTNPSNLRKPESHTDRAVPVGGTPVQSPDANAVRTVRAINSILEPFVPKSKNLPAVIPASRNAEKVVASRTVHPNQRLDQFIEGQIPGGRQFGKQRAKTEREYRDVFYPAVEREYNQIWDEAIKRKPDFGYEEVIPRRSPYAPPTPTELYVTPQQPIKDTNARYLWELINKAKPNTAHIKRDNPPSKKSNKKKKTSRDDKVTKKADGGLIQFLQDGKTVGRIKAKDMSRWNRDAALDSYNWLEDFDRWAKSYDGVDDVADAYMTIFNGGEDIYDNLTTKTGDYFGGKYNYSVQDPLAKHRQITFRGSNQGFDDLIRKSIIGHGTTEGDSGYDTFAGDRTGNRTLSRGLQQRHVERFNSQLNQRGLELYDKGNGAYRLRKLQTPAAQTPEATVKETPQDATSVTASSAASKLMPAGGKKNQLNLSVMPEDVLALGRMVGGLATNNRAAKLYKKGLKPTLLDTFENTVPLQGNFHAKAAAEQQASDLESMAARPRTSDASLQLAGELEASGRAGLARFQGGLQDADMFYKTRMLGQQESDAAKARRVQTANQNRGSMNAIDAAKSQIDAAKVTANYQQVMAPYLAGIENRFRQNTAMKRQFGLEQAQNALGTEYDANYARIMQQYEKDPVKLNEELTKLRNKGTQDMLAYRKQLLGSPWMFDNVPTVSTKTPFLAKGNKLSYKEKAMLQSAKDFNKRLSDDNKLMHKDIMEAKREHNKLIANMSALTASLIKRGMNL